MINGGGKSASFDNGESVVLPFLRYRGIATIGQFCFTTDRDDNVGSLTTVAESLRPEILSESLSSQETFRKLESAVRLKSDSVTITFLTEPAPVQNLDSARSHATILGLDWAFLDSEAADAALNLIQPETAIFTNYASRYARLDRLTGLRKRFPQIRIISVLESGAVEIQVNGDRYSIWTAVQN